MKSAAGDRTMRGPVDYVGDFTSAHCWIKLRGGEAHGHGGYRGNREIQPRRDGAAETSPRNVVEARRGRPAQQANEQVGQRRERPTLLRMGVVRSHRCLT